MILLLAIRTESFAHLTITARLHQRYENIGVRPLLAKGTNKVNGMKLAIAAAMMLLGSVAAAELPLYQANFDSEPYLVDQTIHQVDGWTVSGVPGATAVVRSGTAAEGSSFVELSSGAVIDRTFTGTDGENLVWVEGYFKGTGSETTLANATYPSEAASAIVHFSLANGIEFLNGAKGLGDGTSVQSTIASIDANTWYKISIRLNFEEQTWDVWINNAQEPSYNNLGFKSANVTKLSGFKNLAQGTSYFDAFRVVLPTIGDANGDARIDAADVAALLEKISGGSSDIILRTNADFNSDGAVDQTDLDALLLHLLGA